MKNIYLDYAASTPVDKDVLDEMLPFFSENFGNPSSVHNVGRIAQNAIEGARKIVADFLNCSAMEIIFTSGATESNNLAIKGAVKAYFARRGKEAPIPHIITSAMEHHCVLDTCKALAKEGLAEVSFIKPKSDGVVDVDDIASTIKDNTILISIMYVNNEIGTIQPMNEIGKLVKSLNVERKKANLEPILFHTDAVQAANYLDCDVEKIGSDMLSLSGHKFYGPKGIGVLYLKKGIKIKPLLSGGSQEMNLRAGTQNVPAIVGLGKAISKIKKEQKENNQKIQKLRDYFIEKILSDLEGVYINGSIEQRIPNNVNVRIANVEGESLLLSLDMEGISASTGSACSSGSLEPSHVLLSIGMKHVEAHSSLRFTIGKNTTAEEIDYTVGKLKEIVERLRNISGQILNEFNNNN